MLILVSSESEGGDVVARKNGELTQQDKQRLASEGIPEDCWEDDAVIMKKRYLKDNRYKSVNVEQCDQTRMQCVLEKITSFLSNTTMPGGEKNGMTFNYMTASNVFMERLILASFKNGYKHLLCIS